ncbi:GbsR/MarR family transcriptional regulator [Amphibacillus sediminis]|uniref:GbsR/MarR family transcriptional regulator n=1 Tax=Amphibacillus sediminis TaxID=360185 RepID=UPI00082CDBA3|nr:helix-turn-helix domain-containing protein [Amphibacillus sediminis]
MTLNKITDDLIHEFAKTVEMFDLSLVEARLFTILYLNHSPMSLDEMSQTVGKSKTSVNKAIRSLSELNLAKQVWKKGTRKDFYTANEDLYQRFMQTYLEKWINHTSMQKQILCQIKQRAKKQSQGKLIDDKIDEMVSFHSLIEKTFVKLKTLSEKMPLQD